MHVQQNLGNIFNKFEKKPFTILGVINLRCKKCPILIIFLENLSFSQICCSAFVPKEKHPCLFFPLFEFLFCFFVAADFEAEKAAVEKNVDQKTKKNFGFAIRKSEIANSSKPNRQKKTIRRRHSDILKPW